MNTTDKISMDDLVALCKRRGFIFPASEIYGGINGFWDFGPLGILLKNNLRDRWWNDMVITPPSGPNGEPLKIVGLDSSIIQNPKVWEASGHVGGFSDPMQMCRHCKKLIRTDHVWDMLKNSQWILSFAEAFESKGKDFDQFIKFSSTKAFRWAHGKGKKLAPNLALVRNPSVTMSWLAEDLQKNFQQDGFEEPMALTTVFQYMATEQKAKTGLQMPCPHCGGDLTEPRDFNLMFKTYIGAAATEDDVAYLRPETAQGCFTNYKNIVDNMRVRVPFGIAQIGKAFRNEVTPRNFIYRSREFEQMEMEWFCHPDEARLWFDFWKDERKKWWEAVGVSTENLQLRQHDQDELSHYAKAGVGTVDIEYRFPFTWPGFGELEGVAHRCDFDLIQHEKHSGKKMEYFDDSVQPPHRFLPHVIEPAAGLTRGVLALLAEAYTADPSRPSKMYLKFNPSIAPVKAAVLPLVNKNGLPEIAQKLYYSMRTKFMTEYDAKSNIGKRYARHDEIGTPFCITVDNDTPKDQAVTIRFRDTMAQERVALDKVEEFVQKALKE
ncbi:MAG: glycine--tRNA ligase [Alphaproteobacteria bacterium]|nr:glycine--tRNA ligase [Alphaproteobacteria bacterium]